MLKKSTIFDFLTDVFVIYGVTTLILVCFCVIFGVECKGYSTIFSLGKDGVSVATMCQFFLMSFLVAFFKWLFFTDIVIKSWTIVLRTAIMFGCVLVSIGIFATVFGWFPPDLPEAWISCLISFLICAFISTGISVIKEKTENRKLQEALQKIKGGEE